MKNRIALKYFKNITILNTTSRFVSTTLSLIIAYSISQVLSNINKVGSKTTVFLISFLGFSVLQLFWNYIFGIKMAKMQSKVSQNFKEFVYLQMLNNKENREKNAQTADFLVLLDKDAGQISSYYTEDIPAMIQAFFGILMYSSYFIIFLKGSIALLCILLIGLLQFVPPYVMKKYLIKNYIKAEETEAVMSQHLISGITGFFTIKMLNIHKWFMGQYEIKQNHFKKYGIMAAATSSVQSAMDNVLTLAMELGFAFLLGIFLLMKWLVFEAAVQLLALSGSIYEYIRIIFSIQTNKLLCEKSMERFNMFLSFSEGSSGTNRITAKEENTLSFDNITVLQDGKPLFDHVNLEIKGNGIWLLQGPNGTGKSTFFHRLMGQLRTDQGEICLNHVVLTERDLSDCFSYCAQTPLKMQLTGEELLQLLPYNIEAVLSYLKYFNVPLELLNKPLQALSGGERKKIMLSICLAKDAPVVLLDEPEASLDQDALEKLIGCLRVIPKIIIIISHVDQFLEYCRGVILLQDQSLTLEYPLNDPRT